LTLRLVWIDHWLMRDYKMGKKILIFNAFPTNNGDAALVFSLYDKLVNSGWGKVSIAAHKFDLIKNLYEDFPIVREITDYKFLNNIKGSAYLKTILTPILIFFSKPFMQADVVIASPGGFMNSYYGFSRIAVTFIMCKLLGKKTGIYSQSFGPFNKRDKYFIKFLSRFIDVLYCRDNFSYNLMSKLGVKDKKIHLVEDGAFLIPFEKKEVESNIVAISVRSWQHDSRSESHYINMIKAFVEKIVNSGFQVEFISTCQGLENYIDDSKFADFIFNQLPENIKASVIVNHKYYTLHELQLYIDKFNAVIGTRLHMCILSLLRGKPCLNISYEIKGKEAFSYLGLGAYSIDYNEDVDNANSVLTSFLENQKDMQKYVEKKMHEQNIKADKFLNEFIKLLS